MGKFLLFALISSVSLATLLRPWLGITAYYLLAVMGPQYVWFWIFQDVRASFLVSVATLAGTVFWVLGGKNDNSFLVTRQNLCLLLLWFFITVSYYFGPYVSSFNAPTLSPQQLFSLTNTIFIFYFCSTLVITDAEKVKYLCLVIIITTAYYIYWANDQYFSHNYDQFNWGRLMGPEDAVGGSIYRDENVFAMIFVSGIPFLYYLGVYLKNRWLRLGCWLVIPFGWHAVFLTGSRGGLLGLCVITVLAVLRSKKKVMVLPVLLCFALFYQWQAGSIMKERSELISNYEGEGSAEQRLAAWRGGWRMVTAHPITGVGLGSFITALPKFYDSNPRVAHNTFIQFAAESGVGAATCYLLIVYLVFRRAKAVSAWCRDNRSHTDCQLIENVNNACTASFSGLVVCSFFLSLNNYEIFYLLLLISNSLEAICNRFVAQTSGNLHAVSQRNL